jgi:hypothetical protein
MHARIILIVACLVALPLSSSAQNTPVPTPQDQDNDVQKRADALLDKARHLSDIRSPDAPAFQLKVKFSFTGSDLETVQGTYTEIWQSSSQLRRETVANTWRRIEVAGAAAIWRLDNSNDFPEEAAQLPALLNIFPARSMSLKFDAVHDHLETDPPVVCALTEPDPSQLRSAFCFDKKSGVLLEKIFPEVRPKNRVDHSCDYGAFHKFGSFWFPREVSCFEDRHKKITANIVDLSLAPSPDPALFTPPPGAFELANCPVTPVPPRIDYDPIVMFGVPRSGITGRIVDPERTSWVTVWLVVDVKGRPQHARIVRSVPGNQTLERTILNRLHDLWFKPGTCNGVPMPMPLTIQLPN